jgi:hypothetical protein
VDEKAEPLDQSYRADRIALRFIRTLLTCGWDAGGAWAETEFDVQTRQAYRRYSGPESGAEHTFAQSQSNFRTSTSFNLRPKSTMRFWEKCETIRALAGGVHATKMSDQSNAKTGN